jgi:CHAT domain-containing protein/tetratricopeptide (TPR) repeat protein
MKMKTRTRHLYLKLVVVAALLLLTSAATAFSATGTMAAIRAAFESGDWAALDSLVSNHRFPTCHATQSALENFFATESAHYLELADALAKRLSADFEDDFWARQVKRYRSWSTDQKSKRRDLNRDFAALNAGGHRLTTSELVSRCHSLIEGYLDLADSAAATKVLQNGALFLTARGANKEALHLLARAQRLCMADSDHEGLARSYNLIGNLYTHDNKLLEAGAYFDSARVVRTTIGDELGVADCLNNIADVYLKLDEPTRAREFLTEVLRIRRLYADSIGAAAVLLNMVSSFHESESPSSLDNWVNDARKMAAGSDDPILLARLDQADGLLLETKGSTSKALAEYRRALSILPAKQAARLRLSLLISVARIQNQQGLFADALVDYFTALSLAKQTANQSALANIYHNLGATYHRVGDLETALEYYHQSLAAYRQVQQPCDLLSALNSMAEIYQYMGDSESAIDYSDQAHEVLEYCADPAERARTYLSLRVKNPDYLDSAAAIYRQISDAQGMFDVSVMKADFYQKRGDIVTAEASLHEAAGLKARMHTYANLQKYDLERGLISYDEGQLDTAYLYLARVIGRLEESRREMPDPELRTYRLQSNRFVYEKMVLLFTEEYKAGRKGALDSAFHYIQLSKSRTLLDRLHSDRGETSGGTDSALIVRESNLVDAIEKKERLLYVAAKGNDLDSLDAALARMNRELKELRLKINLADPRADVFYQPSSFGISSVQRKLDSSAIALDYLLTPGRSMLLAISSSDVQVYSLESRETLVNKVIDYLNLLRQSATDESLSPGLQSAEKSLTNVVLGDLAGDIDKYTSVFVCPDGPLAVLPFGALKCNGRFLIENSAVTYLPVLSFLRKADSTETPASGGRLLAVADPAFGKGLTSLPYSRKEADWIAEYFPPGDAKILTGAKAAKSMLISPAISNFEFLHFATHSSINHIDPSRSKLWLARDTSATESYLGLDEVMRLKLKADLVVLSSCESGSGKYNLGEGFEGFVDGFMYAGAHNVVVSLWPVEDFTTSVFMKHFYANLDLGYAQALRQAKLEMLKSPRLRHRLPYYWSAFVLIEGPSD